MISLIGADQPEGRLTQGKLKRSLVRKAIANQPPKTVATVGAHGWWGEGGGGGTQIHLHHLVINGTKIKIVDRSEWKVFEG